MKLSILIVMAALFILKSGFEIPALFFIGYLWTSVLYPSAFATTFFPLSMIFGICFVVGYLFIEKTPLRRPPAVFFLAIAFGIWVTITTFWAADAAVAWAKWNWAIQSIIIVVVTPLLLRTRAQIETALIAILSAISAHVMTGGIKTVLGTGGYDRLGRLMMENFWLGETSTLALVAVMSLPIAYYAVNKSIILEPYRGITSRVALGVYTCIALECLVGTSARTGVISLAALLLLGIKGVVRKALVTIGVVGLFYIAQPFLPEKSLGRFGTIATYQQDDSATIRIGVWHWAMRFAEAHPFGGGFQIFYTDSFDYQVQDEKGLTVTRHTSKTAPHSTYFEVLGEHGYPGILLYLSMMVSGLWGTWRISRLRPGKQDEQWQAALGRTLFVCILLYSVGASFVGIAFQPLLYLFLGLYCSVSRLVYNQRIAAPKFSASRVLNEAAA